MSKKFLSECRRKARYHHEEVQKAWRGMLKHARAAGDQLNIVEEVLGTKKKYKEWERLHFPDVSERKLQSYKQIATHWNHPNLVEARENGIEVESIEKFLQILRGNIPPIKPENGSVEEKIQREKDLMDMMREAAGKEFTEYLRKLDLVELRQLLDEDYSADNQQLWTQYGVLTEMWEAFYRRLRELVCIKLGDDYYTSEERLAWERAKREHLARATTKRKNKTTDERVARTEVSNKTIETDFDLAWWEKLREEDEEIRKTERRVIAAHKRKAKKRRIKRLRQNLK